MAATLLKNTTPELTVAEVAKLKSCSPQYVRRLLDTGELAGEKRLNERNRPVYFIPLSALDADLQMRYRRAHGEPAGKAAKKVPEPQQAKPMEAYSLQEQQRIALWIRMLKEWREFRAQRNSIPKAEVDAKFVVYATVHYQAEYQQHFERELDLTVPTLMRHWRAYRDNDFDGLVDMRGKANKGRSGIPPIVWDAFLSFYLDERQHPVARCLEYTQLYIQEEKPELLQDIPHISSFYRRIENDLPEPLKVLGRKGEKAYRDRCAPYIRRVYDDMASNEYWIADTHTLDVISNTEDGRQHRLYLVAFFDARSQIFVGCQIADQPSSQATLCALRKCIKEYGIPDNIYVDNGREFLTHDVGGLGHRAKKKHKDEFQPPPIFERLGINMINAIVRNARAKTVERRFRDVKDHLSRLFPTFTGGNVVERPEVLKYNLKAGKIIADKELKETAEMLLRWYFNQQPYGGAVVKDQGKPRMQVYRENLSKKRMPQREEDLNLLMMRSSRLQKIGRRGVNLKIGGVQYDYFNDIMLNSTLFGQEVYYRYDPEDISSVRIYDKEDRLLTIAPVDDAMIQKYGASKEDISAAVRENRRIERAMKVMLEHSGLDAVDRIDAVSLLMAEAKRQSQMPQESAKPKEIYLTSAQETPLYGDVVGLDYDLMIENAERRKKGGFNDE